MSDMIDRAKVQSELRAYLVHESSEIAQNVEQIIAALPAVTLPDVAGLVEEAGKVVERLEQRDTSRHGYTGHPLFNRDGRQAADTIRALVTLATAQAEQIAGLEDELHTMKTAGVIEVAIRNPSVSDYIHHWEDRAEAAETAIATERAKVERLVEEAGKVLEGVTPGRWEYRMGDICVEGSDGDDRVIAGIGKSCGARSSVYSTIPNHKPEGLANASFIAWCREGVPALISLATALTAQNNGLQACIEQLQGPLTVAALTARAEAAEAVAEKLQAERQKLGRDLNVARYGQPDFAWSVHKQAMADLETALAAEREKVAKLVEALRALIDHTHNCEKALTEELHHVEFCGESLPLTVARAAITTENQTNG